MAKHNLFAAAGVLVEVHVQYVEIYIEKMYDLLKRSPRAMDREKKNPASLGARGLSNATKIWCDKLETFQKLLKEGEELRRRGGGASDPSSRSHALMVVSLSQQTSSHTLRSVGYLADLAGSEDMAELAAGGRTQQVR